jgi:hypothetical protein
MVGDLPFVPVDQVRPGGFFLPSVLERPKDAKRHKASKEAIRILRTK